MVVEEKHGRDENAGGVTTPTILENSGVREKKVCRRRKRCDRRTKIRTSEKGVRREASR